MDQRRLCAMSDRLKTSIERAKFHGLLETAQFLQDQADLIVELEENINLKADFIERTINSSASDYQLICQLKELVRSAFYEGWASYDSPCNPYTSDDEEWERSAAREALEKLKKD